MENNKTQSKSFRDIQGAFDTLKKLGILQHILDNGIVELSDDSIKCFKDGTLLWTIKLGFSNIALFDHFIGGTYESIYRHSCFIRETILQDYAFDDEVNWFADIMEELIAKVPDIVEKTKIEENRLINERRILRNNRYPYYIVEYNYKTNLWNIVRIDHIWPDYISRTDSRGYSYISDINDSDIRKLSDESLQTSRDIADEMNAYWITKICRCGEAFAISPDHAQWFIDRDLQLPNNCDKCIKEKNKNKGWVN